VRVCWCWTGVREKHCWLAGNQPAEQGHGAAEALAFTRADVRVCWMVGVKLMAAQSSD
jgi:hypothetical protein